MRRFLLGIAVVLAGCGGGGGGGGSHQIVFEQGSPLAIEYGQQYRIRMLQGGSPVTNAVFDIYFNTFAVERINEGGGVWSFTLLSPHPNSGVIYGRIENSGPTDVLAAVNTRSTPVPTFKCRVPCTVNGELRLDVPFLFKLSHGTEYKPKWSEIHAQYILPFNVESLMIPEFEGHTQAVINGQTHSLPVVLPIEPETPPLPTVFTVEYI